MRQDILKKCAQVWKRYQTVAIVLLAGIVLMLFPDGEEVSKSQPAGERMVGESAFDLDSFENELSALLTQVSGAGETTILLTLKSGERSVLAQDVQQDEGSLTTSVVTVGKGSSGQNVVELQKIFPQYQGAVILCQGAEDPQVRLVLSEAVSAVTGLGSDRIIVCKRK